MYFKKMHISVLPAYAPVYQAHDWYLWRPEEDIRSSGTRSLEAMWLPGIEPQSSATGASGLNH